VRSWSHYLPTRSPLQPPLSPNRRSPIGIDWISAHDHGHVREHVAFVQQMIFI
jgi:hypothetical protein